MPYNAFTGSVHRHLARLEAKPPQSINEVINEYFDLETSIDDRAEEKRLALAIYCLRSLSPKNVNIAEVEKIYHHASDFLNNLDCTDREKNYFRSSLKIALASALHAFNIHDRAAIFAGANSGDYNNLTNSERMIAATIAKRAANTRRAYEIFSSIDGDSPHYTNAQLGKAQTLWLLARRNVSYLQTRTVSSDSPLQDDSHWLQILIEFSETKDSLPAINFAKKRKTDHWKNIRAFLIALCDHNREHTKLARHPRNVARSLKEDSSDHLYYFAKAAERLANLSKEPSELEIWQLVKDAKKFHFLEDEMLFLAALVVSLEINKKLDLAESVRLRYASLCLQASEGRTADLIGCLRPLKLKSLPNLRSFQTEGDNRFIKYLNYGKAGSKIVSTLTETKIKQLFASSLEAERLRAEAKSAVGEIIANHIPNSRGAMGRVAQLGGILEADLPYAIRDRLIESFYDVPKMSIKEVEQILSAELGENFATSFKSIDEVPLGSGTLAQVHRATTINEEDVALKIKYPNIEKSIGRDFRLMRRWSWVVKSLFPKFDIDAIFKEWENIVAEECDFKREQNNRDRIATILEHNDQIHIPQIIDEHTSDRIIAYEFAPGLNFKEFLQVANQQEKDAAAERILQATFQTMAGGFLKHDFHPGNFVFNDNSITLLDFGACCELGPDKNLDLWNFMMTMFEDSPDEHLAMLRKYDRITDEKIFDFDSFWRLQKQVYFRPLMNEGPFNFRPNFARQIFEAHNRKDPNITSGAIVLPPSQIRELTYYWNLYGTLCLLNATVDFRKIFEEAANTQESEKQTA